MGGDAGSPQIVPTVATRRVRVSKLPAAEAPGSRVARRKETTKRRLLEVARQLFSEKGIYWATVEDITEMADIGKGTFYKHFNSKETILRVLLEEGLGDVLAETERAILGISSGPKLLSAVIGARVDYFLGHPDSLLMFHQIRGLMQLQVEAAKELRSVYDAHLRRLAQLLRPAVGDGDSNKARDVATAVAAYTSGLLTYHLLFEGIERITRRRESIVQALDQSLQVFLKSAIRSR